MTGNKIGASSANASSLTKSFGWDKNHPAQSLPIVALTSVIFAHMKMVDVKEDLLLGLLLLYYFVVLQWFASSWKKD